MEHHEREYFISRIRSGYYSIVIGNKVVKIYPPTLEDSLEINTLGMEAYNECKKKGIPTEDEMLEVLISRDLWTDIDEEKYQGLPKDIDNMKVNIYESRFNEQRREKARTILRQGEEQYLKISRKRNMFYEHTCDGQAMKVKGEAHIKSCTFFGNELYDFKEISIDKVWLLYSNLILSEKQIRQLARTEPWRSCWILGESKTYQLFHNNGRELNPDQKNLLIWTRTYDNIEESIDVPSTDVINDDDALDGWFIVQRRKRDKEKMEAEIDKHEHARNADEVFVMVGNSEDAKKVDALNSPGMNKVKRERHALIKQKGEVQQHEFRDERLKIMTEHNQNFKGKFKNG